MRASNVSLRRARRALASLRALAVPLLLGGASAAALAQPFSTPPPPAAPRPFTIAAPAEQRLTNGMRLIVAHRDGVPLVSAELVALSGSEADPPRLAGLAALSAGLMTEGTRRHSAPALAAAAEALGGSIESGAGWNQASVSMTVTTPKLDAALALIAEVATEPVFAPAEIERIRTQTLDQLKVAYSQPAALAGLVAQRLVYGNGPYGHPASGTPESLPRIQRSDLIALHRATFRPDNAVLILTGDIDAATALTLARKHFGAWTAAAGSADAKTAAASALASASASESLVASASASASASAPAPTAAVLDLGPSGQAAVIVAIALPPQSSTDRVVGGVMNSVLGGGYSSRLSAEIRVKRGLSYGANSGFDARGDGALFRASVQTKNASAAEVLRLVQTEMDRLPAEAIAADELAARKAGLIGGFSRSVETTAGLAGAIASLVVTHRSPSELGTRIERIEAVTPADVQRYAAAHLGAAGRRLVVAGDATAFGAALQAEQPAAVVIPLKALDLDTGAGLGGR